MDKKKLNNLIDIFRVQSLKSLGTISGDIENTHGCTPHDKIEQFAELINNFVCTIKREFIFDHIELGGFQTDLYASSVKSSDHIDEIAELVAKNSIDCLKHDA